MAYRSRAAAASLALGLLALPLFAGQPPGGETPQALVARLKTAYEKNDFPGIVDCIAPAQRRELAAGLVMGTTMMVAFMDMGSEMAMGMAQGMAEGMAEAMGGEGGETQTAEQKAEMEKAKAEAKRKTDELRGRHEAILERHGLKQRMEAMQGSADTGGSPEEAMAKLLAGVDERALIVDLMGFMQSLGESQGKMEKKPMLPGEITDYRIDGDHATARAGDETVRFVRVDGRWYLEPEQNKGPAAE
jgi:hypothetical protein